MTDCVFFDMDGTLVNTFDGITKSVCYALARMGIEPPEDRKELSPFIGPPLTESFSRFYGLSEDKSWQAVAHYRENYAREGIFDCRVYGGVEDMLAALGKAGKRLFVVTSKPETAARRITDHFGLDRYFEAVLGASSDGSRIQKHQVIDYALRQTGAHKKSVVMVGDRHHDIEGAAANGIRSVGVLYGFGSREELVSCGAGRIAETPKDVVNIILGV